MKIKLITVLIAVLCSFNLFSIESTQNGFGPCDCSRKNPSATGQNKDVYQSKAPYHLNIQMKKYDFSTFFEIDSEDSWRGNVKKSIFRLRNNYDLSDRNGWCATGIKRIFSLGTLFNWAAEIDIWGINEEYLGFIDGKLLTTAQAKFNIYDRNNELVGIAYYDLHSKGVTISPPGNETWTLAKFTRIYTPGTEDNWEVVVYEPDRIDDRIIRIFAAFCVDSQDSFKEDK